MHSRIFVVSRCIAQRKHLEIAFHTLDLRAVCESAEAAEAEFGPDMSRRLRTRLSDLRSAANIASLPVGSPFSFNELGSHYVSIRIGPAMNLIFEANHPKCPLKEDGTTDWDQVFRLKLIRIEKNAH